jgi:hypothetical protein
MAVVYTCCESRVKCITAIINDATFSGEVNENPVLYSSEFIDIFLANIRVREFGVREDL